MKTTILPKTKISIEVEMDSYSIYNGQRLIACETSRGDDDWNDRIEKAVELVRLAGGIVKDNRRSLCA